MLEYLLLEPTLAPHGALLPRCVPPFARRDLERVRPTGSERLGRLVAELSFLELSELDREQIGPLLDRILRGIDRVATEIGSIYFTTRVLVPGPYAQAQQ